MSHIDEIRDELEVRAREYYGEEYTTKVTYWTDGEYQITVYHTRLITEKMGNRRWFHCWHYYSREKEAWESFEYHDGMAAINQETQNVAGATMISDEVMG